MTTFEEIWEGARSVPLLYRSNQHNLMAFLSSNPNVTGHSLVVPREPVEAWDQLDPARLLQATFVGQVLAKRLMTLVTPAPARVNLFVFGYRVPHTHLKVVPSYCRQDMIGMVRLSERPPITDDLSDLQQLLAFPAELAKCTDDALTKIGELTIDFPEPALLAAQSEETVMPAPSR
jgi:diadenosine tetraphosphate (Ap4A) HIT family hydrolase